MRISTPIKFTAFIFASALLFIVQQAISNNAGAPTGGTGAPSESNCTSCHTGTAVSNSSSIVVFTNMTNGQYIPDSTYQIEIRTKKSGCSKFGFSTTMLNSNASPTKLGTLIAPSSNTSIQLSTGTRDYITHTNSGTSAIYTDSTEWTFQWTAPSTLAGDAILYIAAAATDNNGLASGDETYLKAVTFPQTTNVPVATITTNVNTACSSDSIYFQASGTNSTSSYEWTFPGGNPATSSAQNVWVKFATAGTKVCSLRVANNIIHSAYVTKSVSIQAGPNVNVSYNSTVLLCEGDSISLGASFNSTYTYQWQLNGVNISGATTNQYFAKQTGTFNVIVTNGNGCSTTSAPVSLNFNPSPTAVLFSTIGTTETCEGDTLLLRATSGNGYSYYWYKDNILQTQSLDSNYYVYQTGDYSVRIYSSIGCNSVSNTLTITFFPKPSGSIAAQVDSICAGDVARLSAFNLDTIVMYQWYKDSVPIQGANMQEYFASSAGSYMVDLMTNRGCKSTFAAKEIKVNPLPPANFIDTAKNGCTYIIQIRFPGNYTYQWLRDGSAYTNNVASVSVNQSGVYSVIVTNTYGCSVNTNSLAITIPTPPANFIDSTRVGCSYVLKLRNVGNFTWQWQRDGITFNASDSVITVTQSGTYSMIITNNLGCTINTNSLVLNIPLVLPTANITPAVNAVICSDSSISYQVTSIAGMSYKWYKNGILISGATQNSLNISDSGDYYVNVDNGFCSVNSAVRKVTVNPNPVAIASTLDSSFCTGDSTSLTSNIISGAGYQWYKNNAPISGANGTTYIAKTGGNYTVKVSLGTCSELSNILPITEELVPAKPTITKNVNVLTSSTASTYQWYKDGVLIPGATQQTYTVTADGIYSVEIVSNNGCKNISSPLNVLYNGINVLTNSNPFSAYPNPVHDYLNLDFMKEGLREIAIQDASGRVVYKLSSEEKKAIIDFSKLEAGIYFIRIATVNDSQIIRVVKE